MSVEPYKVHSGVPLPAVKRSGTRASKYPFATLEVGEMFFVPAPPKTFSSQVTAAGRRLGRKFAVRAVSVEGQAGVGCWRVQPGAAKADTPVLAEDEGDDE